MDPMQIAIFAGVAVIAGTFGGILAGLLGVGGGIVIVPALYVSLSLTGMDPGLTMQVAVGTSLASIIFTAASSSWGHWKNGAIDVALLRKWAPWILVGLALAAAAHSLLGDQLSEIVPQALEVEVFALLGMPAYVCASGSTPLAAVMIFHGASPGAALAFLITGPATNVTTIGVPNVLVVSSETDADLVYEVTRAMYENIDEMRAVHPAAEETTVDFTMAATPVPLHEGAIRYFEETGADIPEDLRE